MPVNSWAKVPWSCGQLRHSSKSSITWSQLARASIRSGLSLRPSFKSALCDTHSWYRAGRSGRQVALAALQFSDMGRSGSALPPPIVAIWPGSKITVPTQDASDVLKFSQESMQPPLVFPQDWRRPGGVVTGHLPQISSHGAGSHASITFDLPSGVLFSLIQAIQSEHHFSSLPPGEQRSSTGSYPSGCFVRSTKAAADAKMLIFITP